MLPQSEFGLQVESDRLVLVEGKDEVNLFEEMIRSWSIQGLQVLDVGGKRRFQSRLEVTLANSRRQGISLLAIGLFRDADENLQGAMDSINTALNAVGLPGPLSPGEFLLGSPSVGVFILPDCGSTGAIEQLCWEAVRETEAGRCSSNYLECLKVSSALQSRDSGKTLVHAYLAAQDEPSVSVGIGALNNYWPLDHSAFSDVRSFLERLASI